MTHEQTVSYNAGLTIAAQHLQIKAGVMRRSPRFRNCDTLARIYEGEADEILALRRPEKQA